MKDEELFGTSEDELIAEFHKAGIFTPGELREQERRKQYSNSPMFLTEFVLKNSTTLSALEKSYFPGAPWFSDEFEHPQAQQQQARGFFPGGALGSIFGFGK